MEPARGKIKLSAVISRCIFLLFCTYLSAWKSINNLKILTTTLSYKKGIVKPLGAANFQLCQMESYPNQFYGDN